MTEAYRTDHLAWIQASNVVNVNPDAVDLASVVNMTAELSVLPSTPTTLVTYTVPVGKKLLVKRVKGVGHIESEFDVEIDSIVRGYGWTSAATPNMNLNYQDTPLIANAGETVDIVATHYDTSSKLIRASLEGELVNG